MDCEGDVGGDGRGPARASFMSTGGNRDRSVEAGRRCDPGVWSTKEAQSGGPVNVVVGCKEL